MQHPQPQLPPHGDGVVDQLARGMETLAEWLPRVVWRYRRELRPMLAAIVLWSHLSLIIAGVQWLMGAYTPAYVVGALATAVAGPLVTRRVAHGRARIERIYLWACGTAATAWGVAAWTFGSFNLSMGSIDLAMGIVATVPWIVHLHHGTRFVGAGRVKGLSVIRGGHADPPSPAGDRALSASAEPKKIERTPQERAALKSEGQTILGRLQTAITSVDGMRNAKAVSIQHDEHGDGWTLRIEGPGIKKVSAVLGDIEVALDRHHGTRVGAIQAYPEPTRASHALLRYLPKDPLVGGLPLELSNEPRSIRDPLIVGVWDDLTPIVLPILQRHVLLGGMTGGGKSGGLNVLLYRIGMCDDALIRGIDLKGGIELGDWAPRMDRPIATTNGEAIALLKETIQTMHRRARMVAAMPGVKAWPASPDRPQLFIVVDEYSELEQENPRGDDPKVLCESIVRLGRACGVQLVAATQKPVATDVGSILPAQCIVKIALHCATDGDGGVILGAGRVGEGWRASRIPEKGYLLGNWPEHQVPSVGRFAYLADDQVEKAVALTLPHQPALDGASGSDPVYIEAGAKTRPAPEGPAGMVLLVLEEASPEALTITEIGQRTGLATATLSKYLGMLVQADQVEKVGARGGFRWAG